MLNPLDARKDFPALNTVGCEPPIFFDGVGGSQVPYSVVNAIAGYLAHTNGNKGGVFPTSRTTDKIIYDTREAVADFINATSPEEIFFGQNFTTITFNVSRALALTWEAGDEIIVSRLDHDANVSPWVRAAEDRGITVKFVDIEDGSCKIRMDQLESLLNERTRLVAMCVASSSVGTMIDPQAVSRLCHKYGALVYFDAVAYAPHGPIDVQLWEADFVGMSAYKFFGPHLGILWGRRELLLNLPAYKIRAAPETLPDRWMNGAQPYELIAGVGAALGYLEQLGARHPEFNSKFPQFSGRRLRFKAAMSAIEEYESTLTWYAIEQLQKRPHFTLWGITDRSEIKYRAPVVALSLSNTPANDIATFLGAHGLFIWSRSVYSISLSERLGLERTGGFLRLGILHYNTVSEIDTFLALLDRYVAEASPASGLPTYACSRAAA